MAQQGGQVGPANQAVINEIENRFILINEMFQAMGMQQLDVAAAAAAAMANQQHQAQIAPPAAARPPRIDQKTFPKLKISTDDETTSSNFRAWETSIRCTVATNNLQWPALGTGLLSILNDGECGKIAVALYPRILNGQIANLDALMDELRARVVGSSYQTKARARFYSRVQLQKETLISFHTELEDLFQRAFLPAERNPAVLLNAFVSGIRTREINKQLHLTPPATYAEALTAAMRLEGILDTVELNQSRVKNGGQLPLAQRHQPTARRDTPMEVDNLNPRKKGNNRFQKKSTPPQKYGPKPTEKVAGGRRPQNSRDKKSNNSPKGSQKKKPAQSNSVSKSSGYSNNKTAAGGKCYHCNRPGHFKRDCPDRRQHRVHNFNVPSTSDRGVDEYDEYLSSSESGN